MEFLFYYVLHQLLLLIHKIWVKEIAAPDIGSTFSAREFILF